MDKTALIIEALQDSAIERGATKGQLRNLEESFRQTARLVRKNRSYLGPRQ